MNLKKQFGKIKNKQRGMISAHILSGIIALGIVFGLNFLWNYVSSVWGLPKLTYLEFLSTLFLISMFIQFFSLKATKRSVNPTFDIIKILGESPYEKQ